MSWSVIQNNRVEPKSASSQILEGIAKELPEVLNKFVDQKKEDLQSKALQELYGLPLDITDPRLREQFIVNKKKLDALAKNKPMLRAMEKANGLEEGELEPFEEDLASAFKYTNSKKEKAPPGGYGAQPTNPEFIEKFERIKKENPDADPSELNIKMANEGIPPADRKDILESELELYKAKKKSEIKNKELLFKNDLDVSTKVLAENSESAKLLPKSQQAINDIKSASQNINWLDKVAALTGFKPLQSASAAELDAATKVFLMEDLKGMNGKINVFLDKVYKDALTDPLKSEESNLVLAEGMQYRHDIDKARIDFINKIAEEDLQKHGYVKGSTLQMRADKEMEKYVGERQKMLEQQIKFIKKDPTNKKPMQEKSQTTRVRFPDGKIRLVSPQDLERAKAVPGAEVVQ